MWKRIGTTCMSALKYICIGPDYMETDPYSCLLNWNAPVGREDAVQLILVWISAAKHTCEEKEIALYGGHLQRTELE